MTAAEFVAQSTAKKRNKYGNKPVVVDGVRIDSRKEARRRVELQRRERVGEIYDLVCQPVFILAPAVRLLGEKRQKPAMKYRADFGYTDTFSNARIVEDVKSGPTAKKEAFRIKLHLMKSVHGIDVRIVK